MPKVRSVRGLREGRGYSVEEVLKAGLTIPQTKALKIRVDSRRKTAHDFNIQELKKLKPGKVRKVKPKKKKRIVPLTAVKGIGPKKAEQLKKGGIDSANSLAKADLKAASKKTGISLRVLEKYAKEAKKVV
jgi:predicted flap endonuclease-1-like 5' DNA nuclease